MKRKMILGLAAAITLSSALAMAQQRAGARPVRDVVREKIQSVQNGAQLKGFEGVSGAQLAGRQAAEVAKVAKSDMDTAALRTAIERGNLGELVGMEKPAISIREVAETILATREAVENINRSEITKQEQAKLEQIENDALPTLSVLLGAYARTGTSAAKQAVEKQLALTKEILTEMSVEDAATHLLVMKDTVAELANPANNRQLDRAFWSALVKRYGETEARKKLEELIKCKT